MRRRIPLVGLVLVLLSAITLYAQEAQITVESVTAHPDEEKTIAVTVADVPAPGIASIQGSIGYDPKVVAILDLIFSEKFNIKVENIDGCQTDSVRFAATLTADQEPVTDGVILELQAKAVGQPGDETEIILTLEVLSDLNYQTVSYKITNGLFKIKAENQPPIADFSFAPPEPTTEDNVQFVDMSTDPDGRLVAFHWDFGDGTTSELQDPQHRFAQPGSYTVKLTVTDDEGATATKTREIFVAPVVTEITIIIYPNPARDRVTIRYYLPRGMKRAELFVFDLTGLLVFSKQLEVTKIEFVWDLRDRLGKPLPNGLYFLFIQGIDAQDRPTRSKIEKMVIQR
ncbi:MAG: PKD domain-containing protein [Candidatus Acetothermia bacterium]|jgi:hypothetical protein|nr:PKD domain-containing protein [Candidatus Acetothermia bacterium]MDH7505594.1 PKD domain-containing protein [Candidatus Acetothermia bacterium]